MVKPVKSLPIEWKPFKYGEGWVDLFVHRISSSDGLPPNAQVKIIEEISKQLFKHARIGLLQVVVDSPGSWFFNEIFRLCRPSIAVTVLKTGEEIRKRDFIHGPVPSWPQLKPLPFKLTDPFTISDLSRREKSKLKILRILSRLTTAQSYDLASLSGFSKVYVLQLMAELADERLVIHASSGKYEGWGITRRGIRRCHHSWNLPSGMRFAESRTEHDYSGWRHRRTSRLWRRRLEASWNYTGRYVEMWECWTELYLEPGGYPDALAWGTFHNQETLFWLEVDSGHLSRKNIILKYYKRIRTAEKYAIAIGLPVVFMVLGPAWVAQRISQCFNQISPFLALISAPWMNSGRYPLPEFGDYCTNVIGILPSNYHNPLLSRRSLPFDPKKYR